MQFENLFGSSGRDPRLDNKKAFVPLEEFSDRSVDPEAQLVEAEADTEADEDEDDDLILNAPSDGIPPPDGTTQYDRLIAQAEAAPAISITEVPTLADKLQEQADAAGTRPPLDWLGEEDKWKSKLAAHGKRGRENPDKHMKGAESVRDNNAL